jgi:energy-coupling factor transporter ATP-binding protein EcfA2
LEGSKLVPLWQSYFVIIEHVLRIMFSLVERMIVLNHGAILSDGPPATLLNDEQSSRPISAPSSASAIKLCSEI